MRFTVSASELLKELLSLQRVIPGKTTQQILENFLFVLKDNRLEITASDMETTLRRSIEIAEVEKEGEIAVPAKLLTDSLKEFPDQPLTFEVKSETSVEISWATGVSQFPYFPADDYPKIPLKAETSESVEIPSEILLNGINSTIYATADEEFRPVMNGIFFDLDTEGITLVASDAHKLVCYSTTEARAMQKSCFILHKKPAGILKGLLGKSSEPVNVSYDSKNAFFEFKDTILVCRLIEGKYPAYRSVIPTNNPNVLTIDRTMLLNSVRRVAVCSDQATSQIKLSLKTNEISISAQDLGFSTSAHERMTCLYDGADLEIGFKASFLVEILNNLPYTDINIRFGDQSRAALILPEDDSDEQEKICALLMPIRLNN